MSFEDLKDLYSRDKFSIYVENKKVQNKLNNIELTCIIAEKDNIKIVIQTKCYHNVVGNKAIQEAVAGMKYYDADKAMVITNSTFTRSAIGRRCWMPSV